MKFLCDRCKTRYSIGDERVRGKILKIRCKNCANVITVREGMPEPGAETPEQRAKRMPTMAVPLVDPAAVGQGALGAAFASQLAKPPPVLQEEWYVSIDGVQSGPFSLANAQQWIRGKPYEADLHCWSEGFDDWLPVDKVSHFRGLRQARARPKTVPPPTPRPRPSEPEVKPLFAATMASIEKSAAERARAPISHTPHAPTMKGVPAIPHKGNPLPNVSPTLASSGSSIDRSSAGPATAKANGTGVLAPTTGRGSGVAATIPRASSGAAALASAFKQSADSAAFHDDVATTAEPYAARRMDASPAPQPQPVAPTFNDDDDNLEIGEVSRVVKLADLMAQKPRVATAQQPALRPSSTGLTGGFNRVGALTGSSPKLTPSQLGMKVEGEHTADESIVAKSFAERHRRGMLLLIVASSMIVLGVIAAVVFIVSGPPDEIGGGLGGTRQIDTSRPEDIVRRQLPPPPNATGSAATTQHKRSFTQRPNGTNTPIIEEPDSDKRLQGSEIEDMAGKQGEGTKRCYMRAQKGAMGFEIADIKKIEVTLSVNKLGVVTDVSLSSHAGDSFGQCLIGRIKSWKFRESSGGTFRISLAFSN